MAPPTRKFAAKAYTSALTDDVIVDTGSTQRLRIVSLNVANAEAATGTISIKIGSTLIVETLGAACALNITHPGGTFSKDWIDALVGDKITATTTAGVKATVTVIFEVLTNQ